MGQQFQQNRPQGGDSQPHNGGDRSHQGHERNKNKTNPSAGIKSKFAGLFAAPKNLLAKLKPSGSGSKRDLGDRPRDQGKRSAENQPGGLALPSLENRRQWLVRGVVILTALAAAFSPFVVGHLVIPGTANPGWLNGIQTAGLPFVAAAPSWPAMTGDLGHYLPWLFWLVNAPLLFWQLWRERQLANETGDFWMVLVLGVLFWLVTVFPTQIGQIGSQMAAWFGGVNPVTWQSSDLIPAAGILCLGLAYLATVRGVFDWTPFTVTAILLAIITQAYQAADASWARLFMAVGLLTGLMEVLRQPVSDGSIKGKPANIDRASALTLVAGALVVFFVLREAIGSFMLIQLEAINAPPDFYVGIGQFLYGNAGLIALVVAAVIAWMLKWRAAVLLAQAVNRLGSHKELKRLVPHKRLRFYDSSLLIQFAILAIWLFTGSL